MNPLRPALALLVALPALRAAAADWAPQLTAGAAWDDNATNANRASDRLGALRLDAACTVEQRTGLTGELALLYGAQVEAEAWPRFDGLDRAAAGPTVALNFKPGLGPFVPVFTLRASGALNTARESGRAGPEGELGLTFAQRVTAATRLSAGLTASRLDARDGVFARGGLEVFVEYAYDFDASWRVLLAARWRHGDVVSYATPPRPDLVQVARVRTSSDTFSRPMIAYSVEAHTVSGGVTVSRALNETTSLNLGCEWRETTRSPLLYVNRLVSLGLTRQF